MGKKSRYYKGRKYQSGCLEVKYGQGPKLLDHFVLTDVEELGKLMIDEGDYP